MVTWTRRRKRPMSPTQSLIFGTIAFLVGMAITVSAAHQAHRSSITQHATPTVGQVLADDEQWHSTRSGGYYTALYEVREPSGALVWARAHGRKDDGLIGRALRVVVDPDDPTYAELPGAPMKSWLAVWLFGPMFLLMTVAMLLPAARRYLPGMLRPRLAR